MSVGGFVMKAHGVAGVCAFAVGVSLVGVVPANAVVTDDFVSTWTTSNLSIDGTSSADNQIKLPLVPDGTYDFTVSWGDGTSSEVTSPDDPDAMHTYGSVGDYQLDISGQIDGWSFGGSGDRLKIDEISHWGPLRLGNDGANFQDAQNLSITADDAPDLSGVTNLSHAFDNAFWFTGSVANWDTSGVTDMSWMFSNTEYFNEDISGWNTSNVTNMNGMFLDARSFNQPIGSWDTSKVTDFVGMFIDTNFNQPIGAWNTSSATDMHQMFKSDTEFNQPLNTWDTSKVTDTHEMFLSARSFDQSLSNWDTANVTNMARMFQGASSFDQNIGAWNVSSVTDMDSMFSDSLSTVNYDALLKGWSAEPVQHGVELGVGTTQYSASAAAAWGVLVNTDAWVISDGGQSSDPSDPQTPDPTPTPTPTVTPTPTPTPTTSTTPGSGLKRQEALVKVPIPNKLPHKGIRQILLPKTLTTAGNKVSIKVEGKKSRHGKRLFRIYTVKSGKDKGKTFIQTYGRKVKITITWSAAATAEFSAFKQIRIYRIR